MSGNTPTWALTDSLDGRGRLNQALPGQLRSAQPDAQIAGPAFTVQAKPSIGVDPSATLPRIFELLDAIPAGSVLVWAAPAGDDSVPAAHLGALSIAQLKNQKCAGAVLEGGCRDLDYAAQAGFPIWSGTITPQSDVCRWEIVEWNVPVEIGGVTVNPGDHVVADAAGIVVVPADLKDGVLEEVEGLQGLIANVLADVEGGDTLGVAFQKNISA
jgi:regulator of RNase E activity RraA